MLPESIADIYASKVFAFYFDTDDEMDNIKSMTYFLEVSNIAASDTLLNDGTYVVLKAENQDDVIILESSGRGSPFSHIIEIQRMPFGLWNSNMYE